MADRSTYPGWVDVRMKGNVVGFVVIPTTPNGKWHAYMDFREKAGSTRLASYATKEQAITAVQKAAFG